MAVYLISDAKIAPVRVDKPILLFGRHPDCDVVLTDRKRVSRKHCCLVVVGNELFVRDLGSMNGIRVNGGEVQQLAPVALGDTIEVGDVSFVVAPHPTLPDESASEPEPQATPSSPVVAADLDLSQATPVVIPEGAVVDEDDSDFVDLSGPDVDDDDSGWFTD